MIVLALVFGLVMSVAHYFSESFSSRVGKFRPRLISLSAGVAVAYLFLDLLPAFTFQAVSLNRLLFFSVLVGFAGLHLVERYIYTFIPRTRLRQDLALEDSTVSFVYHFILGIVISQFAAQSVVQGLLLVIPVLLYTMLSTLP
ncbi:MAG: hypothetical protein HY369_02550, partial [Candidatus Aenigmarchaeota archaeon]|nr:hypothetical protein [Candidatus Aenigmarchaeota archaeon]